MRREQLDWYPMRRRSGPGWSVVESPLDRSACAFPVRYTGPETIRPVVITPLQFWGKIAVYFVIFTALGLLFSGAF